MFFTRKSFANTNPLPLPSPPVHELEEGTDPPLQLSYRRINKRNCRTSLLRLSGLNGMGTFPFSCFFSIVWSSLHNIFVVVYLSLFKSNIPVLFRGIDSESHVGIIRAPRRQQDPQEIMQIWQSSCWNHRSHSTWRLFLAMYRLSRKLLEKFAFLLPATERQFANIIKTAKTSKRQGSTMVDLGSGNGRVASFSLKLVYHSTG